jgi:hypothetical protein
MKAIVISAALLLVAFPVEAADNQPEQLPECYVNGKPGTCYPSVNQCQSCCVGQFDCRNPTGAAQVPKATINAAPSRQIPATPEFRTFTPAN